MNEPESDRIRTLEERFAYLEKHFVQQDRAMLEMAGRIDGLETRLQRIRERLDQGAPPGAPVDERPPHY